MDIIEIIKQKKFNELTTEELVDIKELASNEEEYNAVRELYLMNSAFISGAPQPSVDVKNRLDDLFHEVHPKVRPIWYMSAIHTIIPNDKPFIQQPLLKVAAILILALLFVPFFTSNDPFVRNNKVAQVSEESNFEEEKAIEQEEIGTDELSSSDDASNTTESIRTPEVIEKAQEVSDDMFSTPHFDMSVAEEVTDIKEDMAGSAMSDHPDGIFMGSVEPSVASTIASAPGSVTVARSMNIAARPEVLDLLTATF